MAVVLDLRPKLAERRASRDRSRRIAPRVAPLSTVDIMSAFARDYQQIMALPWAAAGIMFGIWSVYFGESASALLGTSFRQPEDGHRRLTARGERSE